MTLATRATGLFVLESTDLFVPDVVPLALTRTYRSQDPQTRAFGFGMLQQYSIFLWSALQYQQADLVLPDGGRIHYVRTSPGEGFADAVFEHTASPTVFYRSTMIWNGDGWDIRFRDGTVYVFGENTPLQAIRDRYGNTTTITRSGGTSGDITQVTSPNGRWIAHVYANNRVTQAKDNIGRTVAYTYDANGNLATMTDPESRITSYTYDSSHRMLTVKPPSLQGTSGNLVTNEYDTAPASPTLGWVKKQTTADGGVYQFAYTVVNGKSAQTDITDPRGFVRRVTFNADGYVLTDTKALGQPEQQTTTFTRQPGTQFVSTVVDALNRQTTKTFDGDGNVLTITGLAGTGDAVTTTYTYGINSQITTITDPLNHTTTFGYDALGNLTGVTDALNHATTMTYNAIGRRLTISDALQHAMTFGYAGADLVTMTDALGRTARQFVDAGGRILNQTDAAGFTTRYTYNRLNHVTSTTDPLGGLTTFGYDTANRLQTITDARNNPTTFGYDVLDRQTSRTDAISKTVTFGYDQKGNSTQRVDRRGQISTLAYDALDRPHQISYADGSTITYTYDAGDRLVQIVDSANGTLTRIYDGLDRLTSESGPQGAISYTYDNAGRRATSTVTGQPTVTFTYDDANRLTSLSSTAGTMSIGYDAANRRSTLTYPNGIVVTHGYDNADQLTSLTYASGSTLGDLTYGYDQRGNRTSVGGSWARTSLPPAVASATYDAANRVATWAGAAFSYDFNGNLVGNGPTSYAWDAREQLVSMTGSVSASFTYDGVGRRRHRNANATTTYFLHDGINLVQEQSGAGTPTANLLVGLGIDETFTRTDGGGASALLSDAIGSTVALASAAATVTTQYTFDPFGASSSAGAASTNAMQFTGRENDGTGVYNFRARYADPMTGQFLSEDPIGPSIRDSNRYRYAMSNPVVRTDPLGLDVLLCSRPLNSVPGSSIPEPSPRVHLHAGNGGSRDRTEGAQYPAIP